MTEQIERVTKGIKVQPPSFKKSHVDLPPITNSTNKSMSVSKNPQKKPQS